MNVRITSFCHTTKMYTESDGKTIDWNNRSDRKWLESHMHWAMHNNIEVRIWPETVTAYA